MSSKLLSGDLTRMYFDILHTLRLFYPLTVSSATPYQDEGATSHLTIKGFFKVDSESSRPNLSVLA